MEKGLWYIIIVQSELFLDRGVSFFFLSPVQSTNSGPMHTKCIGSRFHLNPTMSFLLIPFVPQ